MSPLSILIVGAGKLGRETGLRLSDAGHKLTFVKTTMNPLPKPKKFSATMSFSATAAIPKYWNGH